LKSYDPPTDSLVRAQIAYDLRPNRKLHDGYYGKFQVTRAIEVLSFLRLIRT